MTDSGQQVPQEDATRFGASPREWLERWDRGEIIWSVSMGGLGPSYEQAIQITATEVMRHLLDVGYDVARWTDNKDWQSDLNDIERAIDANPVVSELQISGAQRGAACNLALCVYRRGPVAAFKDPKVQTRLIQVSKSGDRGRTFRPRNTKIFPGLRGF